MKSSLERKVAAAFIMALTSIIGLSVLQYRTVRRLNEDSRLVSHTQDVLLELLTIRNSLNRADASGQSFVITGDATYLESYSQAIKNIGEHVQALRKLTVDNAAQKRRIDNLEPLVKSGIRALQLQIDSRITATLPTETSSPQASVGRILGDVRTVLQDMETAEIELLRQRNEAAQQANRQANLLILFGSLLAVVLLGASAIALYLDINERKRAEESLRSLSGRLLQMQEDERRHIGRELHDSLGQYLSALKIGLHSLQTNVGQAGGGASQELAECIHLAEQSLAEVRTASYLLYPPMLDELGLRSAVPMYLEGFAKRSGIKTTFEIPPNFGRVPRDVELALFRVLQECLTNVHRHSGSPTAHVRVFLKDGGVRLEVKDAGGGMPAERLDEFQRGLPGKLGVGLRGMNERVRQFGGKLDVSSNKQGTTVSVTIPSAGSGLPVAVLPADQA
ncbi:MAG TPA: CHASE3 domain-containing protein [Acidobacteriota bacterium]|jgi:signal transduction histidine kinase